MLAGVRVRLTPGGVTVVVGQGSRSDLLPSGHPVPGTVRSVHRVQPHARGGYDAY